MNYRLIFYSGATAFLLFLLLTVFLAFYFRIFRTIGNLSGINARRDIQKKKPENQKDPHKRKSRETGAYSGEIKIKHGKTTARLVSKEPVQGMEETTLLTSGHTAKFIRTIDIVSVHSEEKI